MHAGRLTGARWNITRAVVVAAALLALAGSAGAQVRRPGDTRPELPPFEPPETERGTVLPPLELPTTPDTEGVEGGIKAYIRSVVVTGNTAIPDEQIAEITAPYENRELSFSDLEELRDRLTLAYVNAGYVTSGAAIPPQSLSDGELEIQVVEGKLVHIDIENDGHLRDSFIRDRLRLGADTPVNVNRLEERLQILQQDPRVETINAALVPGEVRGESVLRVGVKERPRGSVRLRGDNYESPAIGSAGGAIRLGWDNVTGFGDRFRAEYRMTEGLREVIAGYRVPLNAWDTTFEMYMDRTWSSVERDFDELDIKSRTQTYGIRLSHPLVRSFRCVRLPWDDEEGEERCDVSLDASVAGEWRKSKTFLLGSRFSFVPSTADSDGEARVTVLRLGQDFAYRTRKFVAAARSLVSIGLPILGATHNSGDIADGEYVSWLGQVEFARRFPSLLNTQILVRGDVQLTNKKLLSLEQFALGGHATVRGYRENTLVRDNGLVGSLEVRVPVWSRSDGTPIAELAPFLDGGRSWTENGQSFSPTTLWSVGVGGRFRITKYARFNVYYGHALEDVDYNRTWDLQDSGVHMGLTVEFP